MGICSARPLHQGRESRARAALKVAAPGRGIAGSSKPTERACLYGGAIGGYERDRATAAGRRRLASARGGPGDSRNNGKPGEANACCLDPDRTLRGSHPGTAFLPQQGQAPCSPMSQQHQPHAFTVRHLLARPQSRSTHRSVDGNGRLVPSLTTHACQDEKQRRQAGRGVHSHQAISASHLADSAQHRGSI